MTPPPKTHIPVMLPEVLAHLVPQHDQIYVDGTFGLGGYTSAILEAAPCRVIAFDRDPAARAHYDALPAHIRARCTFIDAPFSRLSQELSARGIDQIDGLVLDLGVSSPQLDIAERGFSFRFDGPLDMRMDPRVGISAAEVVNTYDEGAIADILYEYGEEKKARSIARAIVKTRKESPLTTTQDLVRVIHSVIRPRATDKIDPCTRSFQALRIFVNGELDELQDILAASLPLLAPGGRLVVVTFHSLEDRIVKQFLTRQAGRDPNPSRYAPVTETAPSYLHLLTTRAVAASDSESRVNPRARSAKLRAATRTHLPYPQKAAA